MINSGSRNESLVLLLGAFLLLVATLSTTVSALHFYLPAKESKCFVEELPGDTTLVGIYKVEKESKDFQNKVQWAEDKNFGTKIVVDDMTTTHNLVDLKASSSGKFSFTAASAGPHSICFSSSVIEGSAAWYATVPTVRVHLDLAYGNPAQAHAVPAGATAPAVSEAVRKAEALVLRLQTIRRELEYQRNREETFRDLSESVNSKIRNWTLMQMVVIVGTAAWQMRQLKTFFATKKLL